ncbi:MAG: substrate-binding domain-containing protein [Chloroflexota bacterium]
MVKNIILLTVIFSILGSIQAQEASDVACPLDDGILTIAWLPKSLDNNVFALGQIGAEVAVEELNATSPCDIELFVTAPINASSDEQIDLLNDIIQLGTVDAIAISCTDAEACVEPINLATEMGIVVMTWDGDAPESDRITYLGVDNYEGGQIAADLLIRSMGTSGDVAILTGAEVSANLTERLQGFMDIVSDYDEIEIVEIIYTTETALESVEGIEGVMETYPDLDGWFFIGLWPLTMGRGAMPLWEEATLNGDLFTVSFDTLPFQLDFLVDGYIVGLVGQKYWGWGYDSIYILHDHIIDGIEFESFTDSGMDVVTINNADVLIEAWETLDFSQELPPPFEEDEP